MGFQQPSQALCPCVTEVFPAATLLQETGGAICKPSDVKAAKSKFRLVGGREEGEGGEGGGGERGQGGKRGGRREGREGREEGGRREVMNGGKKITVTILQHM